MRKTWTLATICGLLAVTSACSGGGGTVSSPSLSPEGNTNANGADGANEDRQRFTITMFDSVSRDAPPLDGRGVQMINERFNVDLKPQFVPSTDYTEKLSAEFASGEIADVIGLPDANANFYNWAKQGAFLPLNDFIEEFDTFQNVPQAAWDALSIDGQIYGIPRYFPHKYVRTPVIRKDWLDNLGLEMPTNYEELLEVAIAFTFDDPDGNGANDTYGLVPGAGSNSINPEYAFGPYWDHSAWYHENEEGKLIPGFVSDGYKELITWLHEAHKAGAVHPDFATFSATDALNEFYAGKVGIFTDQPYNRGQANYETLSNLAPEAEIVAIPPFEAPDGSKGYTASSGFYQLTAISSRLASEPDKVRRILEMLDFARIWHDLEDRNPDNEDFDWFMGYEGEGYTMEDGVVVNEPESRGLQPRNYLSERPWAPNDEANRSSETYRIPLQKNVAASLETMHAEHDHYINPIHRVYSENYMANHTRLYREAYVTQVQMISGQVPISQWEQMVQTYLNNGGAAIIEEVNEVMQANNIGREWMGIQ
ncbi:extracellular solute-binding protein [Paenibacillus senegalensis]|uniref:extracellular solute-binding protein n=1 Tax=Paenibacillus senegalensis TaxID=1465766 RepID=UPI000289C3FF|nr:extracellular solute-binding protein [Paenibacillus senegalensis]